MSVELKLGVVGDDPLVVLVRRRSLDWLRSGEDELISLLSIELRRFFFLPDANIIDVSKGQVRKLLS